MKILLTHRYFWPDSPPYAAILRSIGAHLAGEGHEVHVFASMPSYRRGDASPRAPRAEQLDGMAVRRVRVLSEASRNPVVRVLNVLLYAGALFLHILRVRPDVVTASTFPPVIAAWAASLAARLVGARFVYHMMDIHPEVSQLAGHRIGRGLAFRILRALDQGSQGRAAVTVVLSDDMGATLAARPGGARAPIEVINNFALDSFGDTAPPPADLAKAPDRVRVIFAGNLGRFQDLPLLAEGVGRLFAAHPQLELMFLGDGVALPELKARWQGHEQVRFAPFLPFAQAAPVIGGADIGLVSLSPGIHRVAYPSKVLTYLGLGLPMLALVEPESALARTIRENGLGAVPEARTAEAVADALAPLLEPGALGAAREAAARYHAEEAAPEAVLAKWTGLIAGLG